MRPPRDGSVTPCDHQRNLSLMIDTDGNTAGYAGRIGRIAAANGRCRCLLWKLCRLTEAAASRPSATTSPSATALVAAVDGGCPPLAFVAGIRHGTAHSHECSLVSAALRGVSITDRSTHAAGAAWCLFTTVSTAFAATTSSVGRTAYWNRSTACWHQYRDVAATASRKPSAVRSTGQRRAAAAAGYKLGEHCHGLERQLPK